MIDTKSIEDALGISQKLADSGLVLSTVPASPLNHIVAEMMATPTVDSSDDMVSLIKKASQHDEHDGTIGIIANNAANSVLNTHRLVTDVINPHVREMLEIISSKLESSKASDGTSSSVKFINIPDVLALETFKEAVKSIAKQDLYDIEPVFVGEYTKEELIDAVKFSDVDGFNDVIREVLIDDKNVDIINSVMSGLSIPSKGMGVGVLAALVLASQSLAHTDTIKEGISTSLSSYRARMFWISVAAARLLNEECNKWDSIDRNKHIYRPGSEVGDLTLVRSTAADLAKNGVSLEHLIGNDLIGRKYGYWDFVSDDAKKEVALNETIQAFNRDQKTKRANAEGEQAERLIRVALTEIRDDAVRRGDDEKTLSRLGDTKATLIARATAACEAIYKSGKKPTLDKLGEFIAGVLISIYYAHTDALSYMAALSSFANQYPDMNVVDLAKMARAKLVADWVYSQLAVAE